MKERIKQAKWGKKKSRQSKCNKQRRVKKEKEKEKKTLHLCSNKILFFKN